MPRAHKGKRQPWSQRRLDSAEWCTRCTARPPKVGCKQCEYCLRRGWRNDLWKHYRIREADYDALLVKQNGLCALCKEPPPTGERLHVDHKHGTSAVRGLLCNCCNVALGMLKESPGLCRRAAEYLEALILGTPPAGQEVKK